MSRPPNKQEKIIPSCKKGVYPLFRDNMNKKLFWDVFFGEDDRQDDRRDDMRSEMNFKARGTETKSINKVKIGGKDRWRNPYGPDKMPLRDARQVTGKWPASDR